MGLPTACLIIDFNDERVFSPRLNPRLRIEFKAVLVQPMVAVLLIGSMAIHAQQSLQFTRYDIDDGLGNMTCTPLGMDSVGYLWLGVQPLMRFDGYTFKT
ncbi:MAG: hypothetical protein ACKVOR_07165, partial [Flavobacteriales bacterium]